MSGWRFISDDDVWGSTNTPSMTLFCGALAATSSGAGAATGLASGFTGAGGAPDDANTAICPSDGGSGVITGVAIAVGKLLSAFTVGTGVCGAAKTSVFAGG